MRRGKLLKQSQFFDCFADINVDEDGGFLLSVWHTNWPCCNRVQSNYATTAEAEKALQAVRKREFLRTLRDLTFVLNDLGCEYLEERKKVEIRWNALVKVKGFYGVSADEVLAIKEFVVCGNTHVLNVF